MKIGIIGQSSGSASSLSFSHWLPLQDEDFISVQQENLSLKLWFDRASALRVSSSEQDQIEHYSNVCARYIFADVDIKGISDVLLKYITQNDGSKTILSANDNLQEEYQKLCEDIYVLSVNNFNKMISFIRSNKGQFWLGEYPLELNRMEYWFSEFEAKASTDGKKSWFIWRPSKCDRLIITFPDGSRFIDRATWLKAKEFVLSSKKTELTLELLAGADALAASGYSRSALTEAVTALEVGISNFAKSPQVNEFFSPVLRQRLGISKLANQVERLGLTATLNYLFPVIFTEEQIPTKLLNECQEAITQRQNVVHKGQREVKNITSILKAIRQMCSKLAEYQN